MEAKPSSASLSCCEFETLQHALGLHLSDQWLTAWSYNQGRRCLWQDFFAECLYERVSFYMTARRGWTLNCAREEGCERTQANITLHSYFPTVYEPTVFENYVHGTFGPRRTTALRVLAEENTADS